MTIFLLEGFRQVAALGPDAIACVHCETGALVEKRATTCVARPVEGTPADWEKAHPAIAEALAISRPRPILRELRRAFYVVHLRTRAETGLSRSTMGRGLRFTVETTSPVSEFERGPERFLSPRRSRRSVHR